MLRRHVFFALGFLGLLVARVFPSPKRSRDMKQVIQTEKAPPAIGPYSQAVAANGFLFCSGQIPIDPATGDLNTGTIEDQTRLVLQNLGAILQASGVTFAEVVKATVFLEDMNDFARMNAVYADFFKSPYPARSTVQVARLPRDVKVEIEAVAVLKS